MFYISPVIGCEDHLWDVM